MASRKIEVNPGEQYGKWTVVAPAPKGNRGLTMALCRCICGRECVLALNRLQSGHSNCCVGCRGIIHGLSRTPAYKIAKEARRRCESNGRNVHKYYAGRGIRLCEEWQGLDGLVTMTQFIARKWPVIKKGQWLDRIDNNKGYSPDNIRLCSPRENSNNRNCTIFIEHNGERLPLMEWSRRTGISGDMLRHRVRQGLSSARILAPTKKRRDNKQQEAA